MTSNQRRLRKYRRKKDRCTKPHLFDKYSRLYWRYHFKVYGPHKLLWE